MGPVKFENCSASVDAPDVETVRSQFAVSEYAVVSAEKAPEPSQKAAGGANESKVDNGKGEAPKAAEKPLRAPAPKVGK